MSWTRLSDDWSDRAATAGLSLPARVHVLALIQWCSRNDLADGVVRLVDARRCCDVPAPDETLDELVAAGYLERTGDVRVRVVGIDEHLPSEATRKKTELARERKRRERARKRLAALAESDSPSRMGSVTRDVTPVVTRDVGTGQDGTGLDDEHPQTEVLATEDETTTAVVEPPWPDTHAPRCNGCGRRSDWELLGGKCRACTGRNSRAAG